MSTSNDDEIDESPHPVVVRKNHLGFGFNVRGQVNEGGTLKPIKGQLYAPLQYVSAVLEKGPAQEGGLRIYDRILEINGESAEGLKHAMVVDMIRRSGNELRLTVISVGREEAAHLDSAASQASPVAPADRDMSEKRALPISVPDTKDETDDSTGETYTVYNVYLSGRHIVSRRYSEFDTLLSKLKERFPDFNFPRLPMKWPWKLNAQATDQRRRGLEEWIDQVCAFRAMGEDECVLEFLKQGMHTTKPVAELPRLSEKRTVELRAILPDTRAVSVDVEPSSATTAVFDLVCAKAKLSREACKYFALFEVVEDGAFYRKIRRNEFPHRIYVGNHPTQTSSAVFLRRWLFTPTKELSLRNDDVALNFFFRQAKEDIQKKRVVTTTAEVRHFQQLAEANEKLLYLNAARKLPHYGGVSFPHCACDARKSGHIVVTVQRDGLVVAACSDEGVLQGQETVFEWSVIKTAETDIEEDAFVFKYERNGKEKWMRIFSKFYECLLECVEKAQAEQQWEDKEPTDIPEMKAPARAHEEKAATSSPSAAASSSEEPAPASPTSNGGEKAASKPTKKKKPAGASAAPTTTTTTTTTSTTADGDAASAASAEKQADAPAVAASTSPSATTTSSKPKPKRKPKPKAEPAPVANDDDDPNDGL